ncbi:hypothetical protein Hsw_3607 [Sporocytophaga myxococcoides]|uniref:O-antigen ligase-related domain-containing protein n=2 Tax=Sporocytophaga myxococcoides TaxID=153721 RepID=A0A098LJ05_9BACT|nr:hypothetical protein Hsw_3607 [Sporocytophaga myxococcoides]
MDSQNQYYLIFVRICLFVIIIGMFTMDSFHILANQGILALTGFALLYFLLNIRNFSVFLVEKRFSVFILIFITFIISLLKTNPENQKYAALQFELHYQFLALPFLFAVLPPFPKKLYYDTFFLFLLIVFVCSVGSTAIYFQNKEYFDWAYGKSHLIPTPINHVRYSLMVTFAIFVSFYLLVKNYFNDLFFKFLNIAILIFLIFYQHLLAVRSGLVAFYAVLLLIIFYSITSKNFKNGILVFLGAIALITISFFSLDTLRNKWGYTMYDWNLSDIKDKANHYSIGKRLVSQQVTFELFRDHPIFGVGEGNLEAEVRKGYEKNFSYVEPANRLSPHNQYLRTLAATGILGFIIFMCCFYFPLFSGKNYKSKILLSIYIITSVSFLFEDTLETKAGLTFTFFFIMFCLHYTKAIRSDRDLIHDLEKRQS